MESRKQQVASDRGNSLPPEKAFRKRLAAAENVAVRSRNYRRARERALTALARLHKEEYLDLLAEEKAKDESEGKRWNFASGADADLWTSITNHISDTDRGYTPNNSQNESDNE